MSNVTRLTEQLEQCRASVERLKMLERLEANDDFKKLFLEYYCITHCVDSMQLSLASYRTRYDREVSLGRARATVYFNQFIKEIKLEADTALNEIPNLEREILIRSNT